MENSIERRRLSLAGLTALACAAASAVAMTVWGLAELGLDPSAEPVAVFAAHAGHVALLGVSIFVVIHLMFRRLLFRPLRAVIHQLYGIATGHVESLRLETPVSEIADLVQGLDLMVRRMKQGLDPDAVEAIHDRLGALQRLAERIDAPDLSAELLDHTRRLRAAFTTVLEGGTTPE